MTLRGPNRSKIAKASNTLAYRVMFRSTARRQYTKMFEDRSGRLATTVELAEVYLWKFIAENLTVTDPRIKQHSYDFDLYLPWLLQIFDRHGEQHGERLTLVELQGLYMDAAWTMVAEGFLRPGTRTIDGDQSKDAYGNGYSLTAKGKAKVAMVNVPIEEAAPEDRRVRV